MAFDFTTINPNGAKLSQLDRLYASRISAAIQAAYDATGEWAQITGPRSGVRDYTTQARLYNNYIHHRGGIVAPPGLSRHEKGQAIDFIDNKARRWIQAHSSKFGLQAGTRADQAYNRKHPNTPRFSGDPPHIQLDRDVKVTQYDQFVYTGVGQKVPIPPMNVGETAQGRQMPLGMGPGRISSGPEVAKLQQQLAGLGFNVGKHGVDGVFGTDTAAAVRAFEAKTGLTVDRGPGVAGPQVLGRLAGIASTQNINDVARLAPAGPGYPGPTPSSVAMGGLANVRAPWEVAGGPGAGLSGSPNFSITNPNPAGQRLQAGAGVVTIPTGTGGGVATPYAGERGNPRGSRFAFGVPQQLSFTPSGVLTNVARGAPRPAPPAIADVAAGVPPPPLIAQTDRNRFDTEQMAGGRIPFPNIVTDFPGYVKRSMEVAMPDAQSLPWALRGGIPGGPAVPPPGGPPSTMPLVAARPQNPGGYPPAAWGAQPPSVALGGPGGYPSTFPARPLPPAPDLTRASRGLANSEGNMWDVFKGNPALAVAYQRGLSGGNAATGNPYVPPADQRPPSNDLSQLYPWAGDMPQPDNGPGGIGSINSIMSNPWGLGDIFGWGSGGAAPASAKPPAVPAGGFGDRYGPGAGLSARPYPMAPQQGSIGSGFLQHASGYGTPPTGINGLPQYAALGASIAPGLDSVRAAGESKLSKGAFTPNFGGLPEAPPPLTKGGPGYATLPNNWASRTAPFGYTPPKPVATGATVDPIQQVTAALGHITSSGIYGGPQVAPWASGVTHYGNTAASGEGRGGYSAPQAQTASRINNYLSEQGVSPGPYIGATADGYKSPNFNPISGGAIYSYQPNGFGGGTYYDSYGNKHDY